MDSFDFTIFFLIMLPISQEFGVPLTNAAVVFTVTLWMRASLAGADRPTPGRRCRPESGVRGSRHFRKNLKLKPQGVPIANRGARVSCPP